MNVVPFMTVIDPNSPTLPEGRRARKKAETRARILKAALKLFQAHGYQAVTIEQICEEADIANGTFFLHFPTKTDLLTEFSGQLHTRIMARLAGIDGTPAEKLWALRDAVLAEWGHDATIGKEMVREFTNVSTPGIATIVTSPLQVYAAEAVRAGQDDGSFAKDFEADAVAALLLAGWNTVTMEWATSGDWDAAHAANEAVLRLILRGIEAR